MFCYNCGTEALSHQNFCTQCGTSLKDNISSNHQNPIEASQENTTQQTVISVESTDENQIENTDISLAENTAADIVTKSESSDISLLDSIPRRSVKQPIPVKKNLTLTQKIILFEINNLILSTIIKALLVIIGFYSVSFLVPLILFSLFVTLIPLFTGNSLPLTHNFISPLSLETNDIEQEEQTESYKNKDGSINYLKKFAPNNSNLINSIEFYSHNWLLINLTILMIPTFYKWFYSISNSYYYYYDYSFNIIITLLLLFILIHIATYIASNAFVPPTKAFVPAIDFLVSDSPYNYRETSIRPVTRKKTSKVVVTTGSVGSDIKNNKSQPVQSFTSKQERDVVIQKAGFRPLHLMIISSIVWAFIFINWMPSIIWRILFFLGVSWDSYISLYLILLAINLIYRLPAVISKGNNKWLIYFVCIIFNWTLIGWFICLIWAFSDNKAFNRENEYRNLLYEQTKRNQ